MMSQQDTKIYILNTTTPYLYQLTPPVDLTMEEDALMLKLRQKTSSMDTWRYWKGEKNREKTSLKG